MTDDPQGRLFGATSEVDQHWKEMPEFKQEDQTSWHSTRVHFENWEDMQSFGDAIGQRLLPKTRSIWFPEADIGRFAGKAYVAKDGLPEAEQAIEKDGIVNVRERRCPICFAELAPPEGRAPTTKCGQCETVYTSYTFDERLPKLDGEKK